MGQKTDWEPQFSLWRHGGWYVNNVRYPSGAVGCVSNNFPDKKWRIVCDDRRDELNGPGDFTFDTRDAAARAEHALASAAQVAAQAEVASIPGAPAKEGEAMENNELPECLVQLTAVQKELLQGALANDEVSSDEDLVGHWTGECGIPRDAAEAAVAYRDQFLVNPFLDIFGLHDQSTSIQPDRPRG